MLVTLIADLIRDPKLQEEFSRNPEAFMDRVGLEAQSRVALRSQDPERLAKALVRELRDVSAEVMSWATPGDAEVGSVEPRSAHRGSTVRLIVRGRWFSENAACVLMRENKELPVSDGLVMGSNTNNSTFHGTLKLGPDADIGEYTVHVRNPGQDSSLTGPDGIFEVLE